MFTTNSRFNKGVVKSWVLPAGDARWLQIAKAARQNASNLAEDAHTLFALGRNARAHALGVLAFEEVGKATLCLLAILAEESDVPQIRRQLGDHKSKLEKAYSFAVLLAPSIRPEEVALQVEKAMHAEAAQKLRGFYVDWVDNVLITPDAIASSETAQLLQLLDEILVVAHRMDLDSDILSRPATREQWASVQAQLSWADKLIEALPEDEKEERLKGLLHGIDAWVLAYRDQPAEVQQR